MRLSTILLMILAVIAAAGLTLAAAYTLAGAGAGLPIWLAPVPVLAALAVRGWFRRGAGRAR